jgi:hypothetical protein
MIAQVNGIMEKKAASRPVMPEEYRLLEQFVDTVEGYRLSLREAARSQRRAELEEIRARVPAAAYDFPLEETDLPLNIYNTLSAAGYTTAGQVLEQLYINSQAFLRLNGLDARALKTVEQVITTMDFTRAEPELEGEQAGGLIEAEPVSLEAGTETPGEGVEEAVLEGASDERIGAQPETLVGVGAEDEDIGRAQRAALVEQLKSGHEVAPSEPEVLAPEAEPTEMVEPMLATREPALDLSTAAIEDDLEDIDLEDLTEEEVTALRRERDKRRRRQLVFDEDLGKVVVKRQRKPGRRRSGWDEE